MKKLTKKQLKRLAPAIQAFSDGISPRPEELSPERRKAIEPLEQAAAAAWKSQKRAGFFPYLETKEEPAAETKE
jgi:hypothetical protein